MISFRVTKYELAVIEQIVDRALAELRKAGFQSQDRMTLHMDITACHANGTPLRLGELLKADDFNFAHDVLGINRHIDRKTGKLTDCFSPRFSVRQ